MTTAQIIRKKINAARTDEKALIQLEAKLDRFYNNGLLSASELGSLDTMIMIRLATIQAK